jgi:hypothetical protein
VDQAAASLSCPRCGAECPAGAARCRACGFALIDGANRRPSGGTERRPSGGGSGLPWVVALAAAVAAVAAVFVVLFAGGWDGSPAAGPARTGPPAAVPALEAERRLELRFGGQSDDETAAVRCPYRIEPRQLVRCELRYADGIARAMLVRLTPSGDLDAAIPYPATIRREIGLTRRAEPPRSRALGRPGGR